MEFALKKNQQDALNAVINNNFESGIVMHATGTGKSITGLSIAKEYYIKNGNCNIFWICEHKFILSELLKNKLFVNLMNSFINDFQFYDFSQEKTQNWYELINECKKPVFVFINRSFLVSREKYKRIEKNIDFIMHDECHSIKNKTTSVFYEYLKNNHDYKVIGLSATPYIEYYPFNKVVHRYSLYDAFLEGSVVYPKIVWLNKEGALSYDDIAETTRELLKDLKFKKVILWCGLIEQCEELYNSWQKYYPDFKLCIDVSECKNIEVNDNNNFDAFKNEEKNALLFCAAKHREGSDIKNLDGCVFLDKVSKRTPKTFLQCVGRVLRLQESKNYGLILDVKAKNAYSIIKRMAIYLNYEDEFPYSYSYYYNETNTIKINELIINSVNKDKYVEKLNSKELELNVSREYIVNKFKYDVNELSEEYVERLNMELDMFVEKDLLKYLNFALEILELTKDIPHVTRGSCGSSLVCYLLDITKVDPVKYDIKFERFLNIYRNNLPDIDFDFPHINRDEIFYRLEKKWPGKIARISNHVFYHEKSAKRAALNQMGYNKFIGKYEVDDFVRTLKQEEQNMFHEKVKAIENTFRLYSLHCGGIVFYPEGVPDYLKYVQKSNNVINQITLNKYDIANIKKFKIDILSSRALTQLMSVNRELAFKDFSKICIDPVVMSLFQKGNNIGITLAESPLIRKAMMKILPKNINDLAIVLSIIRPAAKDERETLNNESLIYDDDAINIISSYTNVDNAKADYYRRNFIKNNNEVIDEMYGLCKSEEKKNELFNKIKNLHGYSFCKSHAFSYAELIYKLALIKYYNPKDFWISTLKHNETSYKKWVHYYEARLKNVDFKNIISIEKSIYSANKAKDIYKLDNDEHFEKYGIWNISDGKFYPNCYGFLNKDNLNYYFKGIIAQTKVLNKTIILFLGVGEGKYIEVVINNHRFNKANFQKKIVKGYGKLSDEKLQIVKCLKYSYL